jgi:rhodanese-related sulfurtransferase
MPRQEPGEPYFRVSVDEAKEMLDAGGDLAVVDVRTPDEYTGGHVTGAIHIPIDEVLSRMEELPKDRKLLFICAAGARSGLACEMAAAAGLDSEVLINIEDGTPAWIEKGYPTSYGSDR